MSEVRVHIKNADNVRPDDIIDSSTAQRLLFFGLQNVVCVALI